MHAPNRTAGAIALVLSAAVLAPSATATVDTPIDRWAAAVGGRPKIAAIQAVYREATVAVAGYEGTLKVWHTSDGRYRKEERIAAFSIIETFDGTTGMVANGDAPARVLSGLELAQLKSRRFANSNAMFFVFFPERHRGTRVLSGSDAVVFTPDGGIDWRVILDPQTWLPRTMVHEEAAQTVTVAFASYESVDGVRFEKEIHRANGNPQRDSVVRFTKTVIDPPIDAALFTLAAASSRGQGEPVRGR
jgi:hypothetical protein